MVKTEMHNELEKVTQSCKQQYQLNCSFEVTMTTLYWLSSSVLYFEVKVCIKPFFYVYTFVAWDIC